MKSRTTVIATAAILGGLGLGAAFAPAVKVHARPEAEPAQRIQWFTGGSYIGVSIRDVDEEAAKAARLDRLSGVVVEDVQDDSPAQKAGFREGDVIVEFDGERVRSSRQFTRLVQETPAGREVQAVVLRDGNRTTLTVTPSRSGSGGFQLFGEEGPRIIVPPTPPAPPAPPSRPRPPAFEWAPEFERFFSFSSSGRLGITVQTLSDQLAEYFGVKEGVLVTAVTSGSAAEKAGVRAGDVIVSINGTAVDSSSDLARRTARLADGDEFTLEVVRKGERQTLKGVVEDSGRSRRTVRTII